MECLAWQYFWSNHDSQTCIIMLQPRTCMWKKLMKSHCHLRCILTFLFTFTLFLGNASKNQTYFWIYWMVYRPKGYNHCFRWGRGHRSFSCHCCQNCDVDEVVFRAAGKTRREQEGGEKGKRLLWLTKDEGQSWRIWGTQERREPKKTKWDDKTGRILWFAGCVGKERRYFQGKMNPSDYSCNSILGFISIV